jgi:flavin reductase (DIM6/NTAB) family NADH-FMN oxidoreductase RutF
MTFRQVLGTFATGVTVVTTGRNGDYHGMTANAFTSVSLEPMLVLVCVEHSANTHPILSAAGVFGVSVLAAHQEHLSRAFALKDTDESRLIGIDYRLGRLGVPLLNNTIAYLECRVVGQHEAGDHTIFIGEVEEGDISSEADPLLFYRGRYRRIASEE